MATNARANGAVPSTRGATCASDAALARVAQRGRNAVQHRDADPGARRRAVLIARILVAVVAYALVAGLVLKTIREPSFWLVLACLFAVPLVTRSGQVR